MAHTPEAARKLVRQAGLTDEESTEMLLLINTQPDAVLPIFAGLELEEVTRVVQLYLQQKRTANTQQELPPAKRVKTSVEEAGLEGLQRLAQALLAADVNGEVITLPSDLPRELPWPLRTSIFVRGWYRKLTARVLATRRGIRRGIVVAGTPGVGKSAYVLFLLCHLAQLRCKVMYRMWNGVLKEDVIVFMDFTNPSNVAVEYAIGNLKDLPAYTSRKIDDDTWLLNDGHPPKAQYSDPSPCMYFSSPQEETFKEFCKGKTALNTPLYMQLWDLEELQLCNELLYKVDPEVVRQRYMAFGGVARSVLDKQEDTIEALLDLAKGEAASELQNLQLLSTTKKVLHRLVHLKVDDNLTKYHHNLASPIIAEAIFKEALLYHQNNVQLLLAAAGTGSNLGGLPGMMFEQHGHAVVPMGGKVQMRRLEAKPATQHATQPEAQPEAQPEEEEVEDLMYSHHYAQPLADYDDTVQQPQPYQEREDVMCSAKVCWDKPCSQLSSSSDPMYLRPITTNNAAWDAYYANGKDMWLLQYTMSARHGVSSKAVESFLQRLPLEDRKHVAMVFVVPPDRYSRFAWQPWLGARSKVLQRVSSELKDMQQWVMRLPLLAPATGRASGSG